MNAVYRICLPTIDQLTRLSPELNASQWFAFMCLSAVIPGGGDSGLVPLVLTRHSPRAARTPSPGSFPPAEHAGTSSLRCHASSWWMRCSTSWPLSIRKPKTTGASLQMRDCTVAENVDHGGLGAGIYSRGEAGDDTLHCPGQPRSWTVVLKRIPRPTSAAVAAST